MDKRPNVFNTTQNYQQQEQTEETQPIGVDNDYEAQRLEVAEEIYSSSVNETGMAAVEAMRQRTEEQMRLRDEMLMKNQEQTQSYQQKMEHANQRPVYTQPEPQVQKPVTPKEIKSQVSSINVSSTMNAPDPYIQQLSQPQFNTAFDVLPLPSEGKLYKNKKSSVKVAYMTAADENILTSPNLLQSGEFLEILINRKLLETDLRYKDLHVGDRNAIMIWLRATSYGEMYPVTIYDENGSPFDTEINLNELNVVKLNVEPDSEGYFDFQLPMSKINLKIKLLTIGDVDEIEAKVKRDEDNKIPVNNSGTYTLEKQIVDVGGNRDKNFIREFIQNLRIKDAKELREYINKIDCGVDLNIEVRTPGGGSIKTFLPLNLGFFWPDVQL
jgi:hypothetical protein